MPASCWRSDRQKAQAASLSSVISTIAVLQPSVGSFSAASSTEPTPFQA